MPRKYIALKDLKCSHEPIAALTAYIEHDGIVHLEYIATEEEHQGKGAFQRVLAKLEELGPVYVHEPVLRTRRIIAWKGYAPLHGTEPKYVEGSIWAKTGQAPTNFDIQQGWESDDY